MEQKPQDNSTQWLAEINFGVLPVSDTTIFIEDTVYMDDNLGNPIHIKEKIQRPIKTMVTATLFCVDGELNTKINGSWYHMKKGSFLVCLPGDIIEDIESSGTEVIAGAYQFGKDIVHEALFQKSSLVVGKNLFTGSSPVMLNLDEEHSNLSIQLYKIEKEIIRLTTKELLPEALSNYISTVMCMLASFTQKEMNESTPIKRNRESLLFAEFIDNIHTYAATQRNITFYADKACLSPKYFSRIITKSSGQKPGHWIKKYVVLEAKAMLGTGHYSIQQVSDKLNFPNPSFFCKYFRSVEGRSPGDYMKEKTEN